MKKYCFVVALTPEKIQTKLRKRQFRVTLESLIRQKYTDWEALIIGERNHVEGPLTWIKSKAESKSEKLEVAWDHILAKEKRPEFLIRFDDDDLISPESLSRADAQSFDCYYDHAHAYFDLSTGKTCFQINDWIPNTAIHAFKHAASPAAGGRPLLLTDHSQTWHLYYSDKLRLHPPEKQPFYLRVLSPSCLSIKNRYLNRDLFAEDMRAFEMYVKSIGKWKRQSLPGYAEYFRQLRTAWAAEFTEGGQSKSWLRRWMGG